MKRYQAGIDEFAGNDAQVYGISTDELSKNKEFAESLGLGFPLLSDAEGTVAGKYGVLMPSGSMAKRVTFVIGQDGKIAFVGTGRDAMDPAGAAGACSQLD